jgi:hypothetical protein
MRRVKAHYGRRWVFWKGLGKPMPFAYCLFAAHPQFFVRFALTYHQDRINRRVQVNNIGSAK